MGIIIAICISLGVAIIESVAYLGYFANHLKIPSLIIYILSIFFLFFSIPKAKKSYKIISTSLLLFATITTLAFFSLNLLELFNYQNFVFARFHINLRGLNYLTFLSIFFYLVTQLSHKPKRLANSGLLAALIFFTLANFSAIVPEITKQLQIIIKNPTATYDQKMTTTFPDFYPAIKIIENLTPKDATIIIPPQKIPWVSEGNDAYLNRFLYPRTIIHLPEDQTLPSGKVYLIIARGAWPADDKSLHGWPKTTISAKQIWQIDINSNSSQNYQRDYDPATDTWDWGLIEAKHE